MAKKKKAPAKAKAGKAPAKKKKAAPAHKGPKGSGRAARHLASGTKGAGRTYASAAKGKMTRRQVNHAKHIVANTGPKTKAHRQAKAALASNTSAKTATKAKGPKRKKAAKKK